jgi:hypothetical protein
MTNWTVIAHNKATGEFDVLAEGLTIGQALDFEKTIDEAKYDMWGSGGGDIEELKEEMLATAAMPMAELDPDDYEPYYTLGEPKINWLH